jgi:predicted cobalt transporter CbtA
MVAALLTRGLLAGLVAGLLCFCFLKVYGEPQVDGAISFETQLDKAKAEAAHAAAHASGAAHTHNHADEAAEPELVSRETQAGLGLFVAVMVYSTAFGGLFALAFAFAYGRVPGALTPQAVSALLAAMCFVAVTLVPNLKYPANPPAVGEPETIGMRTALFFVMIAISIAAMVGSATLKRPLAAKFGNWNANLMIAGCYLVVVALAGLLLPAINEVPDQFPAALLWRFRIASLGSQLLMWTAIGLMFGALAQRMMTSRAS